MSVLAAAGEWSTIAAVGAASDGHMVSACEELARASTNPEAFAWLWALAHDRQPPVPSQAWGAFDQLPATIGVLADLEAVLTEFVAAPAGTSSEQAARVYCLARLPKPLALLACRNILDRSTAEDPPMGDVIDAALRRLAGERTAADRNQVLGVAKMKVPDERLRIFAYFTGQLRKVERDALVAATEELLTDCAPTNASTIGVLREAWPKIPLVNQRELMAGILSQVPALRLALYAAPYAEELGIDSILSVAAPNIVSVHGVDVPLETGIDLVGEVLEQSSYLMAADLLVQAHGIFPADRLATPRTLAMRRMADLGHSDGERPGLLRALMTCIVSKGGSVSVGELAPRIYPGELPAATSGLSLTAALATCSLGQLLAGYDSTGLTTPGQSADDSRLQRCGDITSVLDAITDINIRSAVFRELLTARGGIPPFLCAYARLHTDLTAPIIAAEFVADYVTWLEENGAASDHSPGATGALLELVAGARDQDAAELALALLETDLAARSQLWMPAGSFDQALVTALTQWPALLCKLALRQVETLGGAEAAMSPPARLEILVSAALDVDLADAAPDAETSIRHLIGRNAELNALAARWLHKSYPSPALVALCVDANSKTAGPSPFQPVLVYYASILHNIAIDTSRTTEVRVEALALASDAHLPGARRAALAPRGASTSREFRAAAAVILADSIGSPDEVSRIQELVDGETDQAIQKDLLRAIARVQSGDVGVALHNLLNMVGLPNEAADIATVIPDPKWTPRFVKCVDDARAALTSPDPSSTIGKVLKLSELLIQMAVASHYRTSTNAARVNEADLLLRSAQGKPDIGQLVHRPDLFAKFPWISGYITLQGYRDVHPSPIGTIEPVTIDAGAATVGREVLAQLVTGWITAMDQAGDA